jgi:hypothetical protein
MSKFNILNKSVAKMQILKTTSSKTNDNLSLSNPNNYKETLTTAINEKMEELTTGSASSTNKRNKQTYLAAIFHAIDNYLPDTILEDTSSEKGVDYLKQVKTPSKQELTDLKRACESLLADKIKNENGGNVIKQFINDALNVFKAIEKLGKANKDYANDPLSLEGKIDKIANELKANLIPAETTKNQKSYFAAAMTGGGAIAGGIGASFLASTFSALKTIAVAVASATGVAALGTAAVVATGAAAGAAIGYAGYKGIKWFKDKAAAERLDLVIFKAQAKKPCNDYFEKSTDVNHIQKWDLDYKSLPEDKEKRNINSYSDNKHGEKRININGKEVKIQTDKSGKIVSTNLDECIGYKASTIKPTEEQVKSIIHNTTQHSFWSVIGSHHMGIAQSVFNIVYENDSFNNVEYDFNSESGNINGTVTFYGKLKRDNPDTNNLNELNEIIQTFAKTEYQIKFSINQAGEVVDIKIDDLATITLLKKDAEARTLSAQFQACHISIVNHFKKMLEDLRDTKQNQVPEPELIKAEE